MKNWASANVWSIEPGGSLKASAAKVMGGDRKVGQNTPARTVPARFSTYAGMDLGKDNGDPVSLSYAAKSPFAFTGRIDKVIFDVAPVAPPR